MRNRRASTNYAIALKLQLCLGNQCRLRSDCTRRVVWPCPYETFLVLSSAEHGISMLDKSNFINLVRVTFDLWRFLLFLIPIKSKF